MWIYFGLIAALLNALMDLFVKISSGKISNALGGTLLTTTAAVTMIVITLVTRNKAEAVHITWQGLLYSILGGLSVGVATLFIYKMFGTNINLSVAIPFLRICIILFSVLIGGFLLKENLSIKLLIGICVSILGIYLILNNH